MPSSMISIFTKKEYQKDQDKNQQNKDQQQQNQQPQQQPGKISKEDAQRLLEPKGKPKCGGLDVEAGRRRDEVQKGS